MGSDRLPHTIDASVWAAEFKRLFPESDEDLMLGWFANAIMAGWDERERRAEAEAERLRGLLHTHAPVGAEWCVVCHCPAGLGCEARAALDHREADEG